MQQNVKHTKKTTVSADDLPGSLVVRIQRFHHQGRGSIPSLGMFISGAA